ncbi:hypothetical protein MWU75_09480 [Ornithinimicrobium sp. F0845]|uniref:hypothetical protein n=1 Tax=Ornithinimicrobium sp. F0845 TaxID=2926412 RepID=UPI001FF5F295|nr:hypothetical protein [Ornithinimicrobium sp. F0845]MCK0112366.1 hypothetical protein [Ornithinimicrobium sp. F0845]
METLDTFWRFLRATGRMRSGSAEPKVLAKEARRAAPTMIDTTLDSAGRQSMTVEEALEEWSGDPDDWDDDEEFDDGFLDDFTHDETWALEPGPHDEWVQDPPGEDSARDAEQSPYVQQCLRFARWIGDGKHVAEGILSPAHVREAFLEFDLERWEAEFLARSPLRVPGLFESPGPGDRAPDGQLGDLDVLVPTRSLQSLWRSCASAHLIEVGPTRVHATPAADPQCERSPDDWAQLGHRLVASAIVTRHFLEPLDPVMRVLLPFLTESVDRVEVSEVQDWWWEHDANPWVDLGVGSSPARTASDRQVERLLWAADDTGVWRREGRTLHRTALGVDVAMHFMDDLSRLLAG